MPPDERCALIREKENGAEDGTRTRDPHLGKVMLYQLSHFRSMTDQVVGAESQIRTGDTAIFSRVLYQLSYLGPDPGPREGPSARRRIARSPNERQSRRHGWTPSATAADRPPAPDAPLGDRSRRVAARLDRWSIFEGLLTTLLDRQSRFGPAEAPIGLDQGSGIDPRSRINVAGPEKIDWQSSPVWRARVKRARGSAGPGNARGRASARHPRRQ